MRTTYQRRQGKGLTYEITTDRHGGYWISLNDKQLRAVPAPSDYLGKKRFGSKRQEREAVALAHIDIEQLRGIAEE
jgi:hypothetical protein